MMMPLRTLRDSCSAARHDFFVWRFGLGDADQIATHLTREEKRELFHLVRRLRPSVIVEVGSYLGASSSFMASAIVAAELDSTLYCVDTWQNDAMSEGKRDTYDDFLANTASYGKVIRPIRAKSEDAARHFTGAIDLIFFDGDHDYAAVKADWTGWRGHLSPGATVVVHDIGWAPGVQRLVAEQIEPRARIEKRLPNLYWATLKPN